MLMKRAGRNISQGDCDVKPRLKRVGKKTADYFLFYCLFELNDYNN